MAEEIASTEGADNGQAQAQGQPADMTQEQANQAHLQGLMNLYGNNYQVKGSNENVVQTQAAPQEQVQVEAQVQEQPQAAEEAAKEDSKETEDKSVEDQLLGATEEKDEDDAFGFLSKKSKKQAKDYKSLEDFVEDIKSKHSIEDLSTFMSSADKWRKGSQKARELEGKYENLVEEINALPQDIRGVIDAYANGQDYYKVFENQRSLLDYTKSFDSQGKEEVLKTFFPDKFNSLKAKYSEGDIDEDDYNDRIDLLYTSSSRLYDSEKEKMEKQRADIVRNEELRKEKFNTSVDSSVTNLQKDYSNFSPKMVKSIEKDLVKQSWVNMLVDEKGNYKPDAAKKIAFMKYGEDYLNKLVEQTKLKAESETAEKLVSRASTQVRTSKNTGSASTQNNQEASWLEGIVKKNIY